MSSKRRFLKMTIKPINKVKSLQVMMMFSFPKKSNKKQKKRKSYNKKQRIYHKAGAYLKPMMYKNPHPVPFYQMTQ